MNFLLFALLALLFILLTPGIVLTLPSKGSKKTVAITHGLIFAFVWTLIHRPLVALTHPYSIDIGGSMLEGMNLNGGVQGMQNKTDDKNKQGM